MNRNPITSIRRSKFPKFVAAFIAVNILTQLCFPTVSFALTSGPGQEEFASFEPASTSDMVDLYTGDFNYNIPLLSIPGPNGGYPINIAYHSGVSMEQEASWVGLGWSLNVGSINRQLRGLPDDYNGADGINVVHTQKFGTSTTVSLDITESLQTKIFGIPGFEIGVGAGIYYNNYRGLGERINASLSYTTGSNTSVCDDETIDGGGASIGLGISLDSQTGIGIEPDFSVKGQYKGYGGTMKLSIGYNSREGVNDLSVSTSVQRNTAEKDDAGQNMSVGNNKQLYTKARLSGNSSLNFGVNQVPSQQEMPMSNHGYSLTINLAETALWPLGQQVFPSITGGLTVSKAANLEPSPNSIDNNNGYGYIYSPNAKVGGAHTEMDFHRDEIKYSDKIPNLASSSLTYDLYTQTGQGTGSMFRPHLNSNGIVTSPQINSTNDNTDINAALGAGGLIHVEAGATVSSGTNSSGAWQATSQVNDDLDPALNSMMGFYNGATSPCSDPIGENFYWQVYGEKSAVFLNNDDLSVNWGGDQPVRVNLAVSNKAYTSVLGITTQDWYNAHFVAQDLFVNNSTSTSPNLINPPSNTFWYKNQVNPNGNTTRFPRGTNIETFTNSQAAQYGYSRNVTFDDLTGSTVNPVATKDFTTAPDAISEISVLQNDGMRYTYGLPQYNNNQLDATFSVTGPTDNDISKAPIPTANNIDIDPAGTWQDYLDQTKLTQKYASSWLLTSVVSDDYVDLTGNGPSVDDYGYWVKFNYKKTSGNYQWRFPFKDANYIEGMKNYRYDDKGTVSYGQKELYYIESIETKTHIAYFYTSIRQDGLGAINLLNGGIANARPNPLNSMYKLDSIQLFTRASFGSGTTPQAGAIPIKTVRFQYDYSSCPGVPNNSQLSVDAWGNIPASKGVNINPAPGGKLTLKGLCFTYQGSTRGALSPYSFIYGVNNSNTIPYDDTWQDRWGSYKDNFIYNGLAYPAHDFPYTDVYNYSGYNSSTGLWSQSSDGTQVGSQSAALWNLTGIALPTGGMINVSYAQKDYAYLENQRALAMFDIVDFDGGGTTPPNCGVPGSSNDYSNRANPNGLGAVKASGSRVWFKLKQPATPAQMSTDGGEGYLFKNYLEDGKLDTVYYRIYCDLKNQGGKAFISFDELGNSTADYVGGWAQIDYSNYGYGIDASGNYGYITLQQVPLSSTYNTPVNPMIRACIEYLRADRPELLYPNFIIGQNASPVSLLVTLIGGVVTLIPDLAQMVEGFNEYAYQFNWGTKMYLNGRSIIRLEEPTGMKLGGGVKVTQLTLNDKWINTNSGNSPQNFDYGQQYDYTTTDANGNTISSGVAYEPEIGNEESALCTPINYPLSTLLASTYHLFLENPILRSYYPGASVGYSKVTVTSIGKSKAEADNTTNTLAVSAAPVSVYEFYTPKDFPVIPNETDLSSDPDLTRYLIIPGLYSSVKKRKARSQGYSVVLNDMAGKMKRLTVRTQPLAPNTVGKLVSEKDYAYQTVQPFNPSAANALSDSVQVLTYDGTYQTALLGQSNDIFTDMNEDVQESSGFGINFDVDFVPILSFAFPIPSASYNELSMRTVVTNKAIYRSGILDSVVTITDNSRVVEKNLAYDPQTGEPLMTSVTNQFNTPIYDYSYPAYWYYPNMGGAYQNFGVTINANNCPAAEAVNPLAVAGLVDPGGDIDITGYIPSGNTASQYFTNGDQVWIDYATPPTSPQAPYTVVNVMPNYATNPNIITCIDQYGQYAPTGLISDISVIKSGYKNLQTMKAGTLVTQGMSGFTPFNPNNALATTITTPNTTFQPGNNPVIDAKAVQYSDQWGLAYDGGCGQYETIYPPVTTTTLFPPTPFLTNTYTMIYNMVINYYPTTTFPYYTPGPVFCLAYPSGAAVDAGTTTTYTGKYDDFLAYISGKINTMGAPYGVTSTVVPNSSYGISQLEISYPYNSAITPSSLFAWIYWYNDPPPWDPNDTQGTGGSSSLFTQGPPTTSYVSPACNAIGNTINPYITGLEGLWRPANSWAYSTTRTQAQNLTATPPVYGDIQTDGVYSTFSSFPWTAANPTPKQLGNWVKANTITQYSPFGFELENMNAIGVYSAALYGYNNSLVTAVGSNVRYNEIAFDGFEDYPITPACDDNDFRFIYNSGTGNIVSTQAHTGLYSMQVYADQNVWMSKNLSNSTGCVVAGCPPSITTNEGNPWIGSVIPGPQSSSSGYTPFTFDYCQDIGEFGPLAGKEYVISAWAKDILSSATTYVNTQITYTNPVIEVNFYDINSNPISGASVTISPSGNIIEGWQRIYGTFTIPSNAQTINIQLVNNSGIDNVYFDDVRINPFNGNLNTYVYNNTTLKVMAELDPNNYATFYNYDDEGHLTKIKKETTEGIETIKEGRINNVEQP